MKNLQKAKELVSFKTGKLDSNAAVEGGKYPFFTCSQETYAIDNYAFDTECVLLAGNNAAGVFPLKYYSGKFNAYQRTYVIEPLKSEQLSIKYFYYYLRPLLKSFQQQATGATTKFLTIKILHNLDIWLPTLQVQQKIAAILTSYDDLIETNNRRIQLLEKMAEEIYKEWFVRLRFPGHETVKVVKGVPEEWKLESFSTLVNINPREKVDSKQTKPYAGMDRLSEQNMYFDVKEERKGASGAKFRNDDVLFPRITPCLENGKRGYVFCLKPDEVALGSTEFVVFRGDKLPSEYIYLLTCYEPFRKHAENFMVGASGRQRVAADCFDFFLVALPPKEVLDLFIAQVRPLFQQVKNLQLENKNLATTRDTLLPRLISGKLSVENLDINFPPSMEDALA